MIGIAALMASAIAPVGLPADASRRLFSTYPTWALRQDRSAGTKFEALVQADGKVRWCRVVAFVGSERLANEECERLARRRLTPAVGPDGRPILGLYRSAFLRSLDGNTTEAIQVRTWKSPADAVIVGSPAADVDRASLTVFVSANGSVSDCTATTGIPMVTSEAVAGLACNEVRKLTLERLTTRDGQPAPYVTTLIVEFT